MNTQEVLIFAIEKKCGKKISNYNDVSDFKEVLEKEYQIYLSISTLRRFFKTVNANSGVSKKTLNLLCQFLGYSSTKKFMESTFSEKKMSLQQTLYEIKHKQCISNDTKLILLNDFSDDALLISIESIFQKSIQARNISFQKELLELVSFILSQQRTKHLRENIALILWQVLVSETQENFDIFISNHIQRSDFVNNIVLSYIDYDQLNKRYGDVLIKLNNEKINKSDKLFIGLMLGLRNYLNGHTPQAISLDLEPQKLPEILKGRLFAYLILRNYENENDAKVEKILWEDLIRKAYESKQKNLFFIEVVHTFLIIKRIDLIQIILDEFYEDLFDISDGFTYLNRSIYLLAQSFVFIKNNEFKKAEGSLSLVSPLVKKERDFHLWFKLFYRISLFHINKSLEDLNQFERISEKLNFICFDQNYCLNYFET